MEVEGDFLINIPTRIAAIAAHRNNKINITPKVQTNEYLYSKTKLTDSQRKTGKKQLYIFFVEGMFL